MTNTQDNLPPGIRREEVFRTSDGMAHNSLVESVHHLAWNKLVESIEECGILRRSNLSSADVANAIETNAAVVREYLDACDALRRSLTE